MQIKLIPVIAFGPELFRKESRDYPPFDSPDYEALRIQFRIDMLADWGIENLPPYETGSDFVKIADIPSDILIVLIRQHLEHSLEIDLTNIDIDEEVMAFDGGLVLETATATLLPQCCGSLEDIGSWSDLCQAETVDDYNLWIGHPMLVINSKGSDTFEISETTEYPTEAALRTATVGIKDITKAVANARTELENFRRALSKCLTELNIKETDKLATKLSGLANLN